MEAILHLCLLIQLLTYCTAQGNSTFSPLVSPPVPGSSCERNTFHHNGECLPCHCKPTCGCEPLTGCRECNSERACAVGYAEFPICQTELSAPTDDTFDWYSAIPGTLEFKLFFPATNLNQTQENRARYRVTCTSSTESKDVLILFINAEYVKMEGLMDKEYTCYGQLELGEDRSDRGPVFKVTVCTGWTQVKREMSISTHLQVQSPHHIFLDIHLPEVKYCSGIPPTFEYSIKNSITAIQVLSGTALDPKDLVGIEDSEFKLAVATPYTLILTASDGDTIVGIMSKHFTTPDYQLPRLNASSMEYAQVPGAVHFNFPVWSADRDSGFIAPDEYHIKYRLYNTTYPLDWSSKPGNINGEEVKASIAIRHPGHEYEFKLETSVTVYGNTSSATSDDSISITTLPCKDPTPFSLLNIDFVGPPDRVILRITYTKSYSSCYGASTFEVETTSYGVLATTDCSIKTTCEVVNMKANREYNISVVAYNQAGLSTRVSTDGGYRSLTTPMKTPYAPENIQPAFRKDKPQVIITWDPPSIDRGPITNYSVRVEGPSATIVNTTYVGNEQEFNFTGDWNTVYDVKVRSHNSIGSGAETSTEIRVPPTNPGPPRNFTARTWNIDCISLEWDVPAFDGGVISSYIGRCDAVTVHSNKSVQAHALQHEMYVAEYRNLTARICGLFHGSLYNCSVIAHNMAGDSPRVSQQAWTEPAKPQEPTQPKVIEEEGTDTTITLFLPKANEQDLPASAYYVGLEVVSSTDESTPTLANLETLNASSFTHHVPGSLKKYITAKLTSAGSNFVVGNGESLGGYYNAPLTNGQKYNIYYGVRVTRGQISKEAFTLLPSPVLVEKYVNERMNRHLVIGVVSAVVSLVLVLALIAVICFIMRRRGYGVFSRQPTMRAELIPLRRRRAMNHKTPDSDSGNGEVMEPDPIPVSHLKSYITSEQHQISAQYKALPTGFLSPCTAATDVNNKDKNRFLNILAYDHSRVVLTPQPGVENSDYINANYINGYSKKKQYIAASGPKESTCADFWRMIWQHQATCIVMVTKCVEEGKLKCHKYWPDSRKTDNYGDLAVTNTSVESWADFTMTTMSITKAGETETLTVHHFLFLSWPDHGVPKNSTPFLLFRRKVMSFNSSLMAPLVIHCSAGVGRTGTFIAIDYLLAQANAEQRINVFHLVRSLRHQRVSMVQTEDQYRYIYQAVCEAFESQDFHYSAPQFQENYLNWSNQDIIGRQFESLAEISLPTSSEDFAVGNEKLNRPKNQNSSVLPHDNHRAHIISQPQGYSSTYINAVFINSYRRRDMFISTQMPLPSTVEDYLRMIFDHQIHAVVAMEADPFSDSRFGVYLPNDTLSPLETDLFTVTMTKVNDVRADIMVAEVTLTYKQARGSSTHSFRYFQANFWPQDRALPEDKATFITLMEQVEKCHQIAKGFSSICVQCRDSNERTSVFLAVWNALERLKTEQEVDVFHVVELIRMVRPQAIINTEQYGFIYDMLYTYLQEFDLYANYK